MMADGAIELTLLISFTATLLLMMEMPHFSLVRLSEPRSFGTDALRLWRKKGRTEASVPLTQALFQQSLLMLPDISTRRTN